MKVFTRVAAFALALGLSSAANAGLIDLTGDIIINGFHPFIDNDGDFDGTTFGVHLSNLDGIIDLDPPPLSDVSGFALIGGFPAIIDNTFLPLINSALGLLPPAVFAAPIGFGTFGAGLPSLGPITFNAVPFATTSPLGSISTVFDSIVVTAAGNNIDILFNEQGSFLGDVSGQLFFADSTGFGASPNPDNGSITSNFIIDVETSAVPVPAAIWLLGSGLVGLFGFSRKKV